MMTTSQYRPARRPVPQADRPGSRPLNALPLAAPQLVAALDELYARFERLAELTEHKLAALRNADADALQRCAQQEDAELRGLFDQQRRKDAILARLAQTMRQIDPHPPRLSELAARLPEPCASQITARTEGLRRLAEKLRERNQVAAAVARGLQSHVRSVFAGLAQAGAQQLGYRKVHRAETGAAGAGQQETAGPPAWVDALG